MNKKAFLCFHIEFNKVTYSLNKSISFEFIFIDDDSNDITMVEIYNLSDID